MKLLLASMLLIGAAIGPAWAVTSEVNPPAGGPATSAPPPERDMPGTNIVQGRVTSINKDDCYLKDSLGQPWHLRLDGGTRITGNPQVGDIIEAEVSNGRAASIKKVG